MGYTWLSGGLAVALNAAFVFMLERMLLWKSYVHILMYRMRVIW